MAIELKVKIVLCDRVFLDTYTCKVEYMSLFCYRISLRLLASALENEYTHTDLRRTVRLAA